MRFLTAAFLTLSSLGSFAQPGACDDLVACYTPLLGGGNVVSFNSCTQPGTNTQYVWHFGDGADGSGASPIHLYAPGTYTACLVAYWNNCVEEFCSTFTIEGLGPCDELDACFQSSQLSSTGYFFNNCSSPSLNATFIWLFGDGTTSTEASPIHTFAEAGLYTVCLYVTWPDGCEEETCQTLTIGEDPCEGFNACFVTNSLTQPGSFFFDNCTSGQGSGQYVWDFGDGTTSTITNVDHLYQANGTYTVCLTAYYGSCSDSTCTTVVVTDISGPCDDLEACFVTNVMQQPGAYFFDNCSNAPVNVQYLWDFGDGTSSTGTNVDHVYEENGNYTVCLTAYYGDCSDSTCIGVVVNDVGDFCDDLVACFEPLPFENGAYFFSNCSQLLLINIPAYYLWHFGDGTTSDNAQPDHVFIPGTYTVCLTVTHGNCVDEICHTITVGQGPGCDPNYAADFTWTAQGTAVVFIATTNLPTVGYIWHFGDGSDEGYGNVITHLYEPSGPYEVCLDSWYWNEATEDTCWAYRCHLVDPFNIVNGVADITSDVITIFPIPAQDVLTVSGLPASATLRFFAADGRLVLTDRAISTMHHVQVAGLASGTYVLRIDAGERAMYGRVAVE